MWNLLPRSTGVVIVVGLGVVVAWSLELLYEQATGQPSEILKWLSISATIVGVMFAAIANKIWPLIWRLLPVLQSNIFPDMNGNWEGHLKSTWIDQGTNQPLPPIPVEISIRQGLFSVSVTLRTKESASRSTRWLLEAFPDEARFRIWYAYENNPQAQHQHRSHRHDGVALLEMEYDTDPDRLTGTYYTSRRTTGDIDVRRVTL